MRSPGNRLLFLSCVFNLQLSSSSLFSSPLRRYFLFPLPRVTFPCREEQTANKPSTSSRRPDGCVATAAVEVKRGEDKKRRCIANLGPRGGTTSEHVSCMDQGCAFLAVACDRHELNNDAADSFDLDIFIFM